MNRAFANAVSCVLSSQLALKSTGELFGVLPHSNLAVSAAGDKISSAAITVVPLFG